MSLTLSADQTPVELNDDTVVSTRCNLEHAMKMILVALTLILATVTAGVAVSVHSANQAIASDGGVSRC